MTLPQRLLHVLLFTTSLLMTSLAAMTLPAIADDVGVTPARLVELEDGSYVLEADVSPPQIAALRPPVVPERFRLTERPSYRRVGMGLVVRYTFGGSATALEAGDVLLLPWARSAVLLTARWRNGEVHRALLPRGAAGIRVPIEALKPVERAAMATARHALFAGLDWDTRTLLRLLLALGIVAAARGWQSMRLALTYAAGHAIAMLAQDLGIPSLPQALAAGALGIGVALLARAAWRNDRERLWPLLLMLGLIDGLGLVEQVEGLGHRADEVIAALFGATLSIDALQITLIAVLTVLWGVIRHQRYTLAVNAGLGGIAIAFVIAQLTVAPPTGSSNSRDPASQVATARFDFMAGSGTRAGARAAPPRRLEDTAMVFLTVEPMEVRVEVLLRLLDFIKPLQIDGGPRSVIPVNVQSDIAARARQMVTDTVDMVIDGRQAVPIQTRSDFVTVAATGVSTRAAPQAEPLDAAVLGVTLAFSVELAPSEIDLSWRAFPTPEAVVPAVWTDPTGSERAQLTVGQPTLHWTNDLSSYAPPPARAVNVRPPRWPVASAVLVGLAGMLWLGPLRRRRWRAACASVILAVAIMLYPFLRSPVNLPWLSGWKPAPAEAVDMVDGLLTNIYRAFDLRNEGAIYDRLAVGVTGEQLSEVYLSHRHALEIENRGGARARVDDVEVLDVRSVRRGQQGGLRVETAWMVSDSVNHFGHIHYRRNRYDAVLHLLAVEGAWKIRKIDIRDERRVL